MLLIFGLDGATWDLADPWIAAGELPNLARLRAEGTSGTLWSTTPPVTFPAWTTFTTGVNPGKHGIFDFTRREAGTYDVRFVNSTFRKSPTVWRIMGEAGRRVCVLGVPGSYPPEAINGVMVSGFDTPVTTHADRSFVHPPERARDLLGSDGFPFADFQEFNIGPGWHRAALDSLLRGIEVKTRLAQRVLAEERWDCFMLLFGESDTVAHHFWHLHDASSPRYDEGLADELGDAIRRVYGALDVAVGQLIDTSAPKSVLIASDHGFGGVGDKRVHLNHWLVEQGWQSRASDGGSGSAIAAGLKKAALRMTPTSWQARLFRVAGGRLASRLESRARFAAIDWQTTRVYSEELNYFPSLWINLEGREPHGVVASRDYERVRSDVIASLANLRDPETNRPVVKQAWRREEAYHGPYVEQAPDVILELATDNGYSYSCLPSASATAAVDRRAPDAPYRGKLDGMSGSHRANGLYVVRGADVPRGVRADAQMADMGATILAQVGVDVPAEFDGRPVPDNGAVVRAAAALSPDEAESPYSEAEEREIEERLAALGYLQ